MLFSDASSSVTRWVVTFLISLLLFLAVVTIALIAVLRDREVLIPQRFANKIISEANSLSFPYLVEVDDVYLSLDDNFIPNLVVRDIDLLSPTKNPILSFNSLAAKFSLADLISNKFRVSSVTLDGANLSIKRLENGSLNYKFGSSDLSRTDNFDTLAFLKRLDYFLSTKEMEKFQDLNFFGLTAQFEDEVNNKNYTIDGARFRASRVDQVLAMSFDLAAACSGFIYSLQTARNFVESGSHKKVIVVGGDKMSSIINYEDRTTCVIFGDGAGAVMLEPTSDGLGIQDAILRSDGSGRHHLHQKAGGSAKPASHETVDAKEHFVYQEGQQVFKFAVTNMADVSYEIMERNKLKADDIAYLVPHQANKRIIDATANRMGVGTDKVMVNIERFGNTTNGTIPLCLWEWENKLKKGDNIILAAFGGGFTWGSIYLKWAYNS